MPQTFQVLRCYKCFVFQVHPTKKANKWKCKLCGEKQSIKRFYGLGTGKECRIHVQKLNGIRGQMNDAVCTRDTDDGTSTGTSPSPEQEEADCHVSPKKSKWLDFVDPENEDQQNSDNMHLNETEVVLELPKKQPRKAQNKTKVSTKSFNEAGNSLPKNVLVNSAKVYSSQSNAAVKNICKIVPMNLQTKTEIPNKQVLNSTVNNSKWAQFVEDLDKDPLQEEPKTMFSFYDDDDLDAVLDL